MDHTRMRPGSHMVGHISGNKVQDKFCRLGNPATFAPRLKNGQCKGEVEKKIKEETLKISS